jgi:chromosome segregation ATPase
VLVKDLKTAQKALSVEQSARSVAEQILQQSKDVNAALSLKLDNVETSLAITQDKLDRKSKALDSQTTRADEAELRLKSVEDKLKTVEADLKAKGLLLESA